MGEFRASSGPLPRQREILAHVAERGSFRRPEPTRPWRLVRDDGEDLSSLISDDGLAALHRAGWIDGGAGVGNMTEFAPHLTDAGRDELGEARTARAQARPATPDEIDADILRRRAVGLSNARIAAATGRTSCRILRVLDDDIPDAPAPAALPPRDIDPALVDAEPSRPDPAPGTSGASSDEPWTEDEIEAVRSGVAAAIERRGPYKPHKPLLIPYRRIGHALGRTEAAVRSKALPILRSTAPARSGTPETRS